MGGKQAVAEMLVREMIAMKPRAKVFVDLFGGGGSMSFMARQLGLQVVYNEYDSQLAGFVAWLMERIASGERGQYGLFPDEYYQFVTRERFFEQVNLHTPYSEFCRVVYSFGNGRRTYLLNPEIEAPRHLLHDVVVFGCADSLRRFNTSHNTAIRLSDKATVNERRLDIMRQVKAQYGRCDIEQLERLQQLEQLQQLERLQQLQRLTVKNLSYNAVPLPYNDDEVIIYCDPPYRGTGKYRCDFNHEAFDDWLRHQNHTIFISEYTMPSDFYEVFNFSKRVTLGSTSNNKVATERLFSNRPAAIVQQMGLF